MITTKIFLPSIGRSAFVFAAAMAMPAFSQPATTPTDWDARIRQALMDTGDLSAIAAELTQTPVTQQTLRAQVSLALEQGDLAGALIILQKSATPGDALATEQLSRVQEMLGKDEAAGVSLTAAIAATTDPDVKWRCTMRLALLAFDADRTNDGVAVLRRLVSADPSAGEGAGLIAYHYGQFEAASDCFSAQKSGTVAARLLEGNAALRAAHTKSARRAFEAVIAKADRGGDRDYAIERLIATARADKTLPQLADAWLAQTDLPSDRMLPLATVLRELGRVTDLLNWWRAHAGDANLSDVVLSDRFVNEVLGAARAADRDDDAIVICREMLARQPARAEWLNAALRAELDAARFEDADALLREHLDMAAAVPEGLLQLGRQARGLGRNAVALDAAARLSGFGGVNAVQGRLLAASVYERIADHAKADVALRDATQLALSHPVAVDEVSAALEGAGKERQAIELLQATTRSDADPAGLERLASLEIKLKQYDQAVPLLEKIMHAPASPSVRSQAAQRLLEAAVNDKSISALIKRLKERLSTPHGDKLDLTLAVNALLAEHQFDAAVDILRRSALLTEPERLWQLSILFLRNNRLDAADATLRQLVSADPGHAGETLERIAAVAIRRNKPADATAAIAQLSTLAGSGEAATALLAGVYDRLGRADAAANQYRRLLAAAPQNADNWLLWATAMKKAGKGTTARRRLQVLCGEAGSDNAFAVAVDGLLNLDASPAALRVVRRDALLRLAERPTQMILYNVLADLSDELADSAAVVRITEAAVVAGGDERPQLLRQLMETASQDGLTNVAVDCGQSLLSLGDDFPPQLFLQLGQQLLTTGRTDEALRAFSRASECSDPDFVTTEGAKLLEEYSEPAAALRMLRPLADRRDADFRLHVAELAEVTGRSAEAFDTYVACANTYACDMAEAPGGLQTAVIGALQSARSPMQREAVLAMLEGQINALITAPDTGDTPEQINRLTTAMRRASVFCDEPERADRADAAVLDHWPSNSAFKAAAVQDRLQLECVESALSFSISHNVPLPPPLARFAAIQQPAPATVPEKMTAPAAAMALPPLIVSGDESRAMATLDAVSLDRKKAANATPAGTPSPFRTLLMAAKVLKNHEAVASLALQWVDSLEFSTQAPSTRAVGGGGRTATPGRLPNDLYNLIESGWHLLPDVARNALIDHTCRRLAAGTDSAARSALSLNLLLLSAAVGQPPADAAKLGADATAGQKFNLVDLIGRTTAAMPSAERDNFLRAMCAAAPPNRQLALLTIAVGHAAGPFDDATNATIAELAAQVPSGQVLDWGDWFIRADEPAALRVLAEAVSRSVQQATADDPAHASSLVAAAAAFANAGDSDKGDVLASAAIASMSQDEKPSKEPTQRPASRSSGVQPSRTVLLRTGVAALSPKARAALLSNLHDGNPSQLQEGTSWREALLAVLLDTGGDRRGALDVLRAGVSHDPSDLLLLTLYRDRLVGDGRSAELAELAPHVIGATPAADLLRSDVAAALRSLFRGREVPLTKNVPPPLDFATPAATGETDKLAETMRGVLLRVRNGWTSNTIALAPSLGGLPPQRRTASPLDRFATWPGTMDDVLRTLHCPTVNGPAADWLAECVARTAESDPTLHEPLLVMLTKSCQTRTLSPAERATIVKLARMPGMVLPTTFIAALWPQAVADPNGLGLRLFSQAKAAGGGASSAAAKWTALDVANEPNGPLDHEPSPLEAIDDFRLATWLRDLADRDPGAASKELAIMQATGRLQPRAIATRLVVARIAAARGDVQRFSAELNAVLHDWAWQQVAGNTGLGPDTTNRLDLTFALPPAEGYVQRRSELIRATQASLETANAQWPSLIGITRAWATFGEWVSTFDASAAEPVLQKAVESAQRQGNGEHALWAADLADRLGHPDLARQIQKNLLEDRCLPAVRIAPLLLQLRTVENPLIFNRLTNDAASYCHESQLQRLVSPNTAPAKP